MSSPGLRGCTHLQAHRGVSQTTTDDDDRCQRAKQYWPPYTMCRRASNNVTNLHQLTLHSTSLYPFITTYKPHFFAVQTGTRVFV